MRMYNYFLSDKATANKFSAYLYKRRKEFTVSCIDGCGYHFVVSANAETAQEINNILEYCL